MKVCQNCGIEIGTKDGENLCNECNGEGPGCKANKRKRSFDKRIREQALRDCGLVKVRGAMGGTYWE